MKISYLDYLKPKSEARSTKQIRMTKIPMTKNRTTKPLDVAMQFDPLSLAGFMRKFSPF